LEMVNSDGNSNIMFREQYFSYFTMLVMFLSSIAHSISAIPN
jgi:hypothetical protein